MEIEDSNVEAEESTSKVPAKKVRLFSAKEFRSKLASPEKQSALEQFLEICRSNQSHDCVLEYLESGGNCLELFQVLETSTEVPASLVVEVANGVLLQIVSNHVQFHSSANEACRYFLNSHIALVNKMLSLGSLSRERKIVLKLLTTIVTFSKKLAKDVLLHVSFNPTNLEVLTKQTGDKNSVRNAFIHFLVAFLVEGEYPTIAILLEKKGLLPSILSGLQHDPADTVCMVMMTLKTHILENQFVYRTQKMNTFSTPIVKSIVNLYNWKGPQSFNHKIKGKIAVVDQHAKARVNEAVHDFLLVLCTSHKYGVIFRDHQVGLGRRTHNSLMYTVLEGLERPWEHSYAKELVTKVCGACPDLAKTLWLNLKTFLEPRNTAQWLSAVNYAAALVQALEPAGIDFCARELNVYQLAQVIQFLVAPTPILKVIIPEDQNFAEPIIKHHVLSLLIEFLKAVQSYTSAAANWTKADDLRTLKNLLSEHVARNFPPAKSLLKDWSKPDKNNYSVLDHLAVILQLLTLYENVCPPLLESLSGEELPAFLEEIGKLPDNKQAALLQIRAIRVFVSFEPSLFVPSGELFMVALPLILRFYRETKDESAGDTLELFLKNTGIFEGCTDEMQFWINGIFDVAVLDDRTCEIIGAIVKEASQNVFKYLFEMPKFSKNTELHVEQQNFREILESLQVDSLQSTNAVSVKQRGLSPLLLAAFECLLNVEQTKSFKNYFNSVLINLLHFQTTASVVMAIISSEKYLGLVSKSVLSYVNGWAANESTILIKTKAHLTQAFSSSFLDRDIAEFFAENEEEIASRPGQLQNCLNQALFYFTNLNTNTLTESQLSNYKKVFEFVVTKRDHGDVAAAIFSNPVLLQRFSPLHPEFSTEFLVDAVKQFKAFSLEGHLKPFRDKLVSSLRRTLKKSGKKSANYERLLGILEVFGLEHQQCCDVLSYWARLDAAELDATFLAFYCNLLVYTLRKFLDRRDFLQPLDEEVFLAIARFLTFLNTSEQVDGSTCTGIFKTYLEMFPHSLGELRPDLFESILGRNEFCKESALLAGFLLSKRPDFVDVFVANLSAIANKKGLMLALLQATISINASDEVLKGAYDSFEPSILKALQKPQKAGQHFETYRDVVVALVAKFTSEDVCLPYVDKVQKFETSEAFHVDFLTAIFGKVAFGSEDALEKRLNNCVLTLVLAANFVFKKKEKPDDDWTKLDKITQSMIDFLAQIVEKKCAEKVSFRKLCDNEGFQMYCKFCLKFGLPGKALLIKVLRSIVQFVNFEENEAQVLLEMAGSHSEFLDLMLGEDCDVKTELLRLVLVLCQRWPALMQRNHVPVLLAGYHATVSPGDRIILMLLQMYEKSANRTNFYDFKPFLWGSAATSHYSVRQDIQKALWRQPRIGDIVEIIQEDWVLNTITNYPLDAGLIATTVPDSNPQQKVYDLAFFLPLLSSLLAPENEVPTSRFIRSGALALTVVALSSNDKEIRLAACHVIARFHYHLEASRGTKDKLLWVRYVEAVCRGTAVLDDFKLNSFAAIFWAKMALVLTQPLQSLYVPLSQYLSARAAPDLRAVPELYTFLHSSDVNFKETRTFISEILYEGLRTDNDFSVALHAVAFKLIMELFSSHVVDVDAKKLLLMVIKKACGLNLGRKMLCSSYGLLSWLYEVAANLERTEDAILLVVVEILAVVIKSAGNTKFIDVNLVGLILASIIDKGLVSALPRNDLDCFLQLALDMCSIDRKFLTEERLMTLITVANSEKCKYLLKFGCQFFTISETDVHTENLIQLIVMKWINK